MKRVSNIYKNVCDVDNIIEMTDIVLSKVRNKKRKEEFILHKMEHIANIKKRLESKNIEFSEYNIFLITDPKCRVILSQELEDKIINHLIAQYLLINVFEPMYIDSMCATRIGRGTSYAINLMKKYINQIKLKYNNFYILKMDIKKYFYNIDHEVLKKIIKDNIKDIDALNILNMIIDSTNSDYINKEIIKLKEERIKSLKNYKDIRETRDIPIYQYGKGVGIGDMSSQAFGLIYVLELCRYIKEELHIKYFINFMDDFVLIHEDKQYLKNCLIKIKEKMLNEYKLELNKKTRIYSIKEGVEFLGFRFILKNNKLILKLRNKTKIKVKNEIKVLKQLRDYKYINEKKYNMVLASIKGHLKSGNCNNFIKKFPCQFTN